MRSKKLGLWTLTSLVTGNMIGSGVFLLPSNLAYIGSISLYSWIITTIGALFIALTFARMSSLLPRTGGAYAYTRAAYGDFVGFQTAYNYWISVWVGNAAIAVAFAGYLKVFIPALADPQISTLVAIGVVWLLSFVNILGVHRVGILQLLTTIGKLLPLLFIGIVGWFYIQPELYLTNFNITEPQSSHFSAITMAATLTLWSFIGLESATVPAESVENPQKTIPRATLLGVSIAAVVYISGSIVIMGMIPADVLQQSSSPYADAARIIFGDWGMWLIAAGAIISTFGCLNGWILLQSQIPMAAAQEGLFPKFMAKRNKNNAPANAIIYTSILITILLLLTSSASLVKQFELIILMATLSALIPYFLTSVSEIVYRQQKKLPISKRAIFICAVACLYSFWAMMGAGTTIVFYGMLVFFSSVPLYAWLKYQTKE